MKHLNNIFLNFRREILKIQRVTMNLSRHLEKKVFRGVHHNSQQNHLNQKNQNAFVKGDVFQGKPRIFFDFSIFRSTWKPKNRFLMKKIG